MRLNCPYSIDLGILCKLKMEEIKTGKHGSLEYVEACSQEEVIGIMHPLVKEWFFGKFKDLSLTQLYGVKRIWDRKNILISAPTGGTKTLTAFLAILNYLVGLAVKDELENKIYCVYSTISQLQLDHLNLDPHLSI